MRILIPTLGRLEKQITWDKLHPVLRKYTSLVVSKEEASFHNKKGRKVVVCPVQGQGMAKLRQWMINFCRDSEIKKVLLLDDDLTLQKRGEDMRVTGEATKEEQIEMFNWVKNSLDNYVHCALSERNVAWAETEESKEVTKGIQAVGYNVDKVVDSGCAFNKGVPDWFFIEDYHMTLQLFEKGFPNIVSRLYRASCAPANADGGCSNFRTPDKMKEAAHILQEQHPEFVKAVQKKTKTSFGGGVRWNVRVQWKKAFESSQK